MKHLRILSLVLFFPIIVPLLLLYIVVTSYKERQPQWAWDVIIDIVKEMIE